MTSVLVVDDSRFMRTVLERQLTDEGFDVCTARNGKAAVETVEECNPDVVTMDVHMPKMNGIEAVERIMSQHPVPIVMLSAHTEEDAETTLDALDKGAVDFLMKPDGQEVSMNADSIIDQLTETLETVAQVDVTESSSQSNTSSPDNWFDTPETTSLEQVSERYERTGRYPTIIIGASTGGPSLLESIMRELPLSLRARVLIVQHMPKNFTGRLASRLDSASAYTVREAEDGLAVAPGEAVVARGDSHMTVTGDVDGNVLVSVSDDESPVNGIVPSIDVTMNSAAEHLASPCVAVALTGMGGDGARGVRSIKRAGGHTIAQDEETSTVFGIPQRAIQTGHVDKVLPDTNIVRGVVDTLTTTGDMIHG